MFKLYKCKSLVWWNANSNNFPSKTLFTTFDATVDNWELIPNISIRYNSTFTGEIVVGLKEEINYFKQTEENGKTTYWYVTNAKNYTKTTKTLELSMDVYATYIINIMDNMNTLKTNIFVDRAHIIPDSLGFPVDDRIEVLPKTKPEYKPIYTNEIVGVCNWVDVYVQKHIMQQIYVVAKLENNWLAFIPVWNFGAAWAHDDFGKFTSIIKRTDMWCWNQQSELSSAKKSYSSGFLEDVLYYASKSNGQSGLWDIPTAKIIGLFKGPSMQCMKQLQPTPIRMHISYDNLSITKLPLGQVPSSDGRNILIYYMRDASSMVNQFRHTIYLNGLKSTLITKLEHNFKPNTDDGKLRIPTGLLTQLNVIWGSTKFRLIEIANIKGDIILDCELNFTNSFKLNIVNNYSSYLIDYGTSLPMTTDKTQQYLDSIQNQWDVGTGRLKYESAMGFINSVGQTAVMGTKIGGGIGALVGAGLGAITGGVNIGMQLSFRNKEYDAQVKDNYMSSVPTLASTNDNDILYFELQNRIDITPTSPNSVNGAGDNLLLEWYDTETMQTIIDELRWYGFKIGKTVEINQIIHDNNSKFPCYYIKIPTPSLLNVLPFHNTSEIRNMIAYIFETGMRLWNTNPTDKFDIDLG